MLTTLYTSITLGASRGLNESKNDQKIKGRNILMSTNLGHVVQTVLPPGDRHMYLKSRIKSP